MIDAIRALLRVQEIDGEIRDLQARLAEIEQARGLAEKKREAEAAAVDAAREPVEEAGREHRRLEVELADLEANLEKLEAQKYEVSSKQAFEGIQREIDAAKERKSGFEDQILECLDRIDTAKETLAGAEERRDEGERARAEEEKSAAAREAELDGELDRLGGLRAERAKEVGAAGLQEYDRMRKRVWPVVIAARGESCPGCRMVIAPQKRNEIKRAEEIISCLHCARILFDEVALSEG